jgi:ADP-heptose:LPS heptosyltransferase
VTAGERLAGRLAFPARVLLDALAVFGVRAQPRLDGKRVVLVVRLDAIGDYLLWSRFALDLATLYPAPSHRRVLVANAEWAPLARSLSTFDQIVEVNRTRFLRDRSYRNDQLRTIRRLGAEVCIQPTYSREFLYGDALVRASGARERIGSQGDVSNQREAIKAFSDRGYTRLIPADPQPLMELDRNLEFVRGLGARGARPGLPVLVLGGDLPAGFDRSPYYALFPGAGSPLRRWPLVRFAELAARIHARTGWRGVVCGGPGEQELGARLVAASDAPLESWAGRTSLEDLCRIVRDARLLVTNETSAVHIGAAGSTPTVCILGGGHFGRFMPYPEQIAPQVPAAAYHEMECYGCNWRCIYHPGPDEAAPCILGVEVDAVWERVEAVLAASGRNA